MGRCLIVAAMMCVALLTAEPASACDCHDGGPVRQAFRTTPVVFAGRVVSISRDQDAPQRWRVRFQVLEAFKGTEAKIVELATGNTSCDLGFGVGQDWLIYAFQRSTPPGLSTGTCSRSRLLADASEDVAFLRSVRTLKRDPGRIIGQLTFVEQLRIRPAAGLPFQDIRFVLK